MIKALLSHWLATPMLPLLVMGQEGFEPSILSANGLKPFVYPNSTIDPLVKRFTESLPRIYPEILQKYYKTPH